MPRKKKKRNDYFYRARTQENWGGNVGNRGEGVEFACKENLYLLRTRRESPLREKKKTSASTRGEKGTSGERKKAFFLAGGKAKPVKLSEGGGEETGPLGRKKKSPSNRGRESLPSIVKNVQGKRGRR